MKPRFLCLFLILSNTDRFQYSGIYERVVSCAAHYSKENVAFLIFLFLLMNIFGSFLDLFNEKY